MLRRAKTVGLTPHIRREQQPLLESLWSCCLASLPVASGSRGFLAHGLLGGTGLTGLQTSKELTKIFHDWLGIARPDFRIRSSSLAPS